MIVTGGGGSIGSEICDRVVTFGAARLLVIENSEPALYAVTEALAERETGVVIEGRIADIRDRERMLRLMSEFKPDIVFHAAALKHVPILERDWSEGVKTNIFGSVNVADAALAAGAEAMVMISTDKAIEPVSMLGLTKRFAEMYCQALDHDLATQPDGKPRMRLISVRFGNVLASNGSVVPKFKAQIEAGGPVTVTHPDMVRYFMTIREACDLVLTAATHALTPARPDVSVYVLNMGQPVKIVDLAERMIRLSGLQPGHDIEIVFTGMRPGERLNEILFAHRRGDRRDRRCRHRRRAAPRALAERDPRLARHASPGGQRRTARPDRIGAERGDSGIWRRRARGISHFASKIERAQSVTPSAPTRIWTTLRFASVGAHQRRRETRCSSAATASSRPQHRIPTAVECIAIDRRQCRQEQVEHEYVGDDLADAEAVVGRPLIEMRSMRVPEPLAAVRSA